MSKDNPSPAKVFAPTYLLYESSFSLDDLRENGLNAISTISTRNGAGELVTTTATLGERFKHAEEVFREASIS